MISVLQRLSATALLVWAAGQPLLAQTRDPDTHFFEQSFGNLKEELDTARVEGKHGVLIMFNDPDCPWCAKMKATVLSQVNVQEYYRRRFRSLHIDTRGDGVITVFDGREMPEKDFAFKEHRVRATPVFIFVGLDGKVVHRHTGVTRDAEEFLWLGEFVADDHYRRTNYTTFKRGRMAAGK